MEHNKLANPFYNNYIFSKIDVNRWLIKWWEYPLLWFKTTYTQIDTVKNDSGEYYSWVFFYKRLGERIFLMKIETIEGKRVEQTEK